MIGLQYVEMYFLSVTLTVCVNEVPYAKRARCYDSAHAFIHSSLT